jgi:hypothetical protein
MRVSILKSFAAGCRTEAVLATSKGNKNARHQESGLSRFLGSSPRR